MLKIFLPFYGWSMPNTSNSGIALLSCLDLPPTTLRILGISTIINTSTESIRFFEIENKTWSSENLRTF